jgi:asparagine synthase (glutamine-hydrolysing)
MSLAHGVENRCPILDQSVVDVASSINHRFDDGFEEKRILRRAFQNNLPESVIKKRKFPYRSPDSAAFAAKPPDYLELLQSDTELSKLPYLHHQFARALTKKVLTNPPNTISTKENQAFIFLISIVLLHHFFVEQNGINRVITKSSTEIKAVDMRTNYN